MPYYALFSLTFGLIFVLILVIIYYGHLKRFYMFTMFFTIFLLYLRIKPSFSTCTQTLTGLSCFAIIRVRSHAYRHGNLHKSKRLARDGALHW